ncbi:hypothetical protein ABAC460_12670 [Asticcacaulis sp. AC460]|nr:hypothetical protein ABAC460_12670 [Asticcacaulis sp. AC460]
MLPEAFLIGSPETVQPALQEEHGKHRRPLRGDTEVTEFRLIPLLRAAP